MRGVMENHSTDCASIISPSSNKLISSQVHCQINQSIQLQHYVLQCAVLTAGVPGVVKNAVSCQFSVAFQLFRQLLNCHRQPGFLQFFASAQSVTVYAFVYLCLNPVMHFSENTNMYLLCMFVYICALKMYLYICICPAESKLLVGSIKVVELQ